MIASIRQIFNQNFTQEVYQKYLACFESQFPNALDFRIAETPIFIDKHFTQKMLDTGEAINKVIQSSSFQKMTEPALKNIPHFPKESPLPKCLIMDFAIAINEQNEIVPALIELQGFPSLFAFDILQNKCLQKAYSIPEGYSPFLNGYDEIKYLQHLKSILTTPHQHTVLLEIHPHQQKTKIDFYCTEQYFGIPIVCITEIFTEGKTLYYKKNNKKIKIDRIYNRIVLDELMYQTKEIQEKGALLQNNLDIEWVTHPHHFFRISKYLLPFLKHNYIPQSLFADTVDVKSIAVEKFILKPLYSFAGKGVIIDIQISDLEKLQNPSEWILQEKVAYANIITTPTEKAKTEIRLFYFWNEEQQKYVATMNLARLSKGKMIGVDYNKNKDWVGGSLAYFEKH